jgi:hypothetical protein
MHRKFVLLTFAVAAITTAVYLYFSFRPAAARQVQALAWIRDPSSRPDLLIAEGSQCAGAPFRFPTDGMVGFLWDDSFRLGHRHQGIDIFAGTDPGVTPVTVAFPGYLSRLSDWKSSVIIRVPDDPLQPGRQIWVYYTHMADRSGSSFISPDFPPGTEEVYVEAGRFLGYQGNYSGDPLNPVGVHLHVSVVKDTGLGSFRNELDIDNTYDPSPYFGLKLNARTNHDEIPLCQAE